jgi:ABC-type sulfate transport system permease component
VTDGRQYCRQSRLGKPRAQTRGGNPIQTAGDKTVTMAAASSGGDFCMAFLRAIGRFGQLLGLGIPVFAMILQLNGRILPSQMLVMLVAAVCCFGIGRILEGFARP